MKMAQGFTMGGETYMRVNPYSASGVSHSRSE